MNSGVFTTIKIQNSIPLFFNRHHKRLVFTAKKLNIGHVEISYRDVERYLQKNKLTDCALKITITKQNGKPHIVIQKRPLPQIAEKYKLITVTDTRNYRKIYKTTDRAIYIQAKKTAEERGGDDALFIGTDTVIESTIANLFSLSKQGEIITTPIKGRGLNGITRQLIMEQTPVKEVTIHQNTKGPLVLVNCLRIQKVTHLNSKKLIDGQILLKKLQTIIKTCEQSYLSQTNPA